MSPPPREKGRGTRPRASEEEFVLFLQGIPARCRWQELKDLVRQTALHIRQAVVYDDHHGFPTGLGQIIVKNEDEAWRTYHRLSTNGWEGQSLVVTLARTSSPTRPIAGPTKSPHCVVPPNYVAGYSTPPRVTQNMAIPPSPISSESVMSTGTYHAPEYGPVMSPMAVPHQPFSPIFTDSLSQPIPGIPNSPALRPTFCDPLTFGVLPTYPLSHLHALHDASINTIRMNHRRANNSANTSHLENTPRKMVNSYRHGNPVLPPYSTTPLRQPARRTIFVQNLNPQTTNKALRTMLQESGNVEECEVPTDVETTLCKGFARITFSSADEAKRAVALHNSTIFMGSKIRVRIDRNTHTASYSLVTGPNANNDPATVTPVTNKTDQTPTAQAQAQSPANTTISVSSDSEEKKVPREDPPTPKPVDRCQPLVVNGSGIGRRAAVAT